MINLNGLGKIIKTEKLVRQVIEYKLGNRNLIYEVLDLALEDYRVVSAGPKVVSFPKFSTEMGLMIIEYIEEDK